MKNTLQGFSTLELLIAFAVMTLSMTAVIMVAFGNQATAIDTELAQRALYIAQQRLEEAGASIKADFDAVSSELTASAYDATFDTQLSITDISECAKRVESEAFWNRDLRELSNSLSIVVSSPEISQALGNDCATEEVTGWESPEFYNNPEIIHPGSRALDLDVIKNDKGTFAFLATEKTGNKETFWIVEVTDPDNPKLIGQFDTGNNVVDIDVYTDGDTAYAFLATSDSSAQFQVMTVNFTGYPVTNPVLTRIAQVPLPGINRSGKVIAYYDNRVYIGLSEGSGNEFFVFNVSVPSSPSLLGSIQLNHTVNDIAIRGTDVFIAASAQTQNGCELVVIDASNPASMTNPCTPSVTDGVRNFRAPGNFDGTTVETFGNVVYLGRQGGSGDEFYILNSINLNSITSLGSLNLEINSGTKVVGLEVSGELAFIATSDNTPSNGGGPFLIYDVSNPNLITSRTSCEINFSEKSTALDLAGSTVFITNESQNALRIFYPANSCS